MFTWKLRFKVAGKPMVGTRKADTDLDARCLVFAQYRSKGVEIHSCDKIREV